MRRRSRMSLLLALVAGALVLPSVEGVADAPPPAAFGTTTVELSPAGETWRSKPVEADGLLTVAAHLDGRHLEVRMDDGAGWSEWQVLDPAGDHGPDLGTDEAAGVDRRVSEPLSVDASRFEVRADGPGAVTLELVRIPGDRSYDPTGTPAASADAASIWPPIVPRSSWDPEGECQPAARPRVAPAARRIYVHHTHVFAHHEPEEGDDAVRAMCISHVEGRGFNDVGYNFLIDQYGVIYQGRVGGIVRPVVGAHASGFNDGAIGIALIGDFETHTPPAAAVSALDRLSAWLADLHGIDPYAVTAQVSDGGRTTRFHEGVTVALPAIVGHRDTGTTTACPGDHLYRYVRGEVPIHPRVRRILEHDYGWAPTDREPPPSIPTQVIAPAPEPPTGDASSAPAADAPTATVEGAADDAAAAVPVAPLREAVRSLLEAARAAAGLAGP